jgi:PIN domain nuclease of toxin-antitoxin system
VQSEPQERVEATGWLDVRSAAAYLSMTEKAVRHAITSAGLPTHRTPTNRLLLKPSELDEWVVSREGAS